MDIEPLMLALTAAPTAQDALAMIVQAEERWKGERAKLEAELGELPRKETGKAAMLQTQISLRHTWLRDIRPTKIHYARAARAQAKAAKAQEAQGLWAEAVHNICGPDALKQCYSFMKSRGRGNTQIAQSSL